MDSGRALWDTMAPMVFSWDGCLGVVIKCNFTGREAKQYSGEQGQLSTHIKVCSQHIIA